MSPRQSAISSRARGFLLWGVSGALFLAAALRLGPEAVYHAYGLAPSQVRANGPFLEGRTFRIAGTIATTENGAALTGRSGGRVGLDAGSVETQDGTEAIVVVRRKEGRLVPLAVHTYQGLTGHRVAWSLLPVPLIGLLFFREYRWTRRGFVRR